jgi:NADPH:quinone reductase
VHGRSAVGAGAFPQMQERRRSQSRSGGRPQFVQVERGDSAARALARCPGNAGVVPTSHGASWRIPVRPHEIAQRAAARGAPCKYAGVRAVVVDRPGAAEALRPAEVPAPRPSVGQVLVAVEAAGVNPVDVGNRADSSWARLTCPYVVGYEFAGVVVDSGDDAAGVLTARLRPGEAVWGLLPVRDTRWGAYAEQVAVDAELVARRPPALDRVSAAVLPLAGATAVQLLNRLALAPGAWLLVHGAAGGVGHLLVQLASARGLHVAATSRPADRARLLDLGADLWVDRNTTEVAHVAAVELGRGFDGVADLVGGLLVGSLPSLVDGAQAATIVDLHGDYEEAIDRNLTIHGVLLCPGHAALADLADAVDAGLRPTVAATYALADAASAHRRLEAGAVGGKIALTV